MEEIIKKIKEVYISNKKELEDLEDYIEQNGSTEEGIADASVSFEQGYNNALEFVLTLLEQNDKITLDKQIMYEGVAYKSKSEILENFPYLEDELNECEENDLESLVITLNEIGYKVSLNINCKDEEVETYKLDNSPFYFDNETPFGFEDVINLLSSKGNSKWTSLDEIEMNEGDGQKLADFLSSKGIKVESEFDGEWFVKNEYHWSDGYFYPYPDN